MQQQTDHLGRIITSKGGKAKTAAALAALQAKKAEAAESEGDHEEIERPAWLQIFYSALFLLTTAFEFCATAMDVVNWPPLQHPGLL